MRKKLPRVAAKVIVVSVLLVACRTTPDNTPSQESPVASSTSDEEEGDSDEDSDGSHQIEVTRIVIETKVVEVTQEPDKNIRSPRELVICMQEEPSSLYLYSGSPLPLATTHILNAIYESMYTTLSYDYQARGIEEIPSLRNGTAVIRSATVAAGDPVVDISGDLVLLDEGTVVEKFGGGEVVYEGGAIEMAQLQVQFQLKPLVWSDGRKVTAEDSVYSFELAADPVTPVSTFKTERTSSYIAVNESTLEWTGVPGFMDATYFTNVWTPLPRHKWGDIGALGLLAAEPPIVFELSHGPFVVQEWERGDHLTLVPNEHYYRADEQLPKAASIRFKFVESGSQLIAQMLSGQCHIGTSESIGASEASLLLESEEAGVLMPYFSSGTVFEHIDFGINPVVEFADGRPDWFEKQEVRQAMLMCTDRQRMVDETQFGRAELIHSYVPANHILFPDDARIYAYDIAAANRLLDTAGYNDGDGDGWREDPETGTPFDVTLYAVMGNEVAARIASLFVEDMADCGIAVQVQLLNSEQYFEDGREGPLFGRQFDLALFPWLIGIEPNCGLYLSTRIPGEENDWNRNFNNETGFTSERFDEACLSALRSLPGLPTYEQSHRDAIRIWSEEVPMIPLFLRLKMAAARPEVQNLVMNPTQPSELWNIEELAIDPSYEEP